MNIFGHTPDYAAGEIVYPEGSVLGPRVQGNLQLVYVHEGEAHVTVDGAVRHLIAGQATLLLPGGHEYFAFSEAGVTRHGWCQVSSPRLAAGQLANFAQLPPVAPFPPASESLLQRLRELSNEWAEPANLIRDSLIQTILLEFLYSVGYVGRPQKPMAAPVEQAVAYAHKHLHGALGLRQLATAAQVTPQHLIKLFRTHLQMSPMQYLWHLRTLEGARLLRESGLSVAEVGYRCGFQTGAHFSRRIKQHYGVCPRDYRQQAWGLV